MKLLSLFDGSGGFPLAASLCGIEPVMASEVEPYPIAVTRSRFPAMKHLGDVSKVRGDLLEPVEVITFGSPCQDLSVAGLRKGLKHEANGDDETTRSGLFMEAIRIIKEMRNATNGRYPAVAIWENVPGAFSSNRGEDFRVVLEEFIRICEPGAKVPATKSWPYADAYVGEGWSLAYRTLDAQYWGVSQRRRRIYLVMCFRAECASQILFEREGLRGYFETSRAKEEGSATDAEDRIGTADTADEGNGTLGAFGFDPEATRDVGVLWLQEMSKTLTNGTCPGHHNGVVTYTLKMRSGCEGGGKGPLVQEDKSATLSTLNDQYLFQPFVYDARGNGNGAVTGTITGDHECRVTDYTQAVGVPIAFEPGVAQREGGHIYEGVSGTLRATPGDNQMSVAYGVNGDVAGTLDGSYYKGCGERQGIEREIVAVPIHDQATRYAGKHGCKHDGKGNGLGVGTNTDPMFTLTQGDHHAVAIGIDRAAFNLGENALYDFSITEEQSATLVAKGPNAVCYWDGSQTANTITCRTAGQRMPDKGQLPAVIETVLASGANKTGCLTASGYEKLGSQEMMSGNYTVIDKTESLYLVRRLTPLECCRLQGFPDGWGEIDFKEALTAEEYRFWHGVRNTYERINGKPIREYTKEQILKWYNGLHTDSAEYKMWGNGIALPCALYVMQGVALNIGSERV